jgi:hypothetical protein
VGLGGFQRYIMERSRRKKKLSVTVNKEYITMIDASRGLISKSAYVNNILKREFESREIETEA